MCTYVNLSLFSLGRYLLKPIIIHRPFNFLLLLKYFAFNAIRKWAIYSCKYLCMNIYHMWCHLCLEWKKRVTQKWRRWRRFKWRILSRKYFRGYLWRSCFIFVTSANASVASQWRLFIIFARKAWKLYNRTDKLIMEMWVLINYGIWRKLTLKD